MPQVCIKMIDGSVIVTEEFTVADMKTKVKDGQGDATKSVVDVDDIGGETISVNVNRISYIKDLPNT